VTSFLYRNKQEICVKLNILLLILVYHRIIIFKFNENKT